MAFIEFNLVYELGRGINVRAYKNRIENEDAMDIRAMANTKLWHSGFKELTQDDLEKLRTELDPIILDQFGYLGYDLVYFSPTFSLGITSLSSDGDGVGPLVYSGHRQAWGYWCSPNWHGTS